jgi:hypothetical protein
MFDLKSNEDSFAKILQNKNIETYSFNNIGIDPTLKNYTIGDRHLENVNIAKKIIEDYNVDFVIGYSYGAQVLSDMIGTLPESIKGIMFLDPYPDIRVSNPKFIDNRDKRIITKQDISSMLHSHQSTIKPNIEEACLNSFSQTGNEIVIASYPGKIIQTMYPAFVENYSKIQCKSITFFTKNSIESVRDKFIDHVWYTTASHYIMLEDQRYRLADDIEQFIISAT